MAVHRSKRRVETPQGFPEKPHKISDTEIDIELTWVGLPWEWGLLEYFESFSCHACQSMKEVRDSIPFSITSLGVPFYFWHRVMAFHCKRLINLEAVLAP